MKRIFTLILSLLFISWMAEAQPTTQASDIKILPFSGNTNSMIFNWTNGNGTNRIVLVKSSGSTYNPSNSVAAPTSVAVGLVSAYPANGDLSDLDNTGEIAVCVFNSAANGVGNSVRVTNLVNNVDYIVQVYEYNGSGASTSYNLLSSTRNPLVVRYFTAGTPTWVVPSTISSVFVQAWGGGAAGGGNTTNQDGGGGGGGGGYTEGSIAVTSGATINITVAATQNGGTGNGAAGNDSWFSSNSTLVAKGGTGGGAGSGTRAGGAGGILGTGSTRWTGGAGGNGQNNNNGAGGGGGSSGSPISNGNTANNTSSNGVGTSGATIAGGGSGGAGANTDGDGGPGEFPGGGGGGSAADESPGTTTPKSGGNGAPGLVILSYSTAAPTISSATLNYGTGVLVVTLSDAVTSLNDVDGTKFHINNITGTDLVNLTDSEKTSFDGPAKTITFTLTETQRLAALAVSGVTGGAGGAVVLDVDAGGVKNSSGIFNLIDDNNSVTETADAIAPTITSATLDYNTGVLVVTISEGIPNASNVDGTKFHLNNATGTDNTTLSNGEVTSVNVSAKTITFTLTEANRAAALLLSGTTGGNGGAVVLDVDPGGVTDAGTNPNLIDDANAVTETADTTKPTVTSATLNYNTGVLVVTLSETISGLSAIDGTKFHINNTTGTDVVNLTDAEKTSFTATTVTFTLTEVNRIAAIAISGTTGGNGGAVVLDVDASGVTDLATNTNNIDDNNTVTETADTTKPTITSATLNYGTGVLVVTLSEGVKDINGIDGTKFHLNDVTGTDITTLSNAERTSFDQANKTITFTLSEANRIAALTVSGVTGGSGGAVVLDVDAAGVTDAATNTNNIDDNNTVTETADAVAPTITSATLNYGTGVLVVTVSEGIELVSVDATKFHINNITGTDVINLTTPEKTSVNLNNRTITFTLTEANRIAARAISGTTGGDLVAVVLDVDAGGVTDKGTNPNLIDDNNTVTETADTIAPAVASATINYGSGVMVVTLTEGVAALAAVDGTKFHINNITGTDVVNLTNSEKTSFDQNARTVTFTLTEAQRVAAIAISGTAGGNGGAAILDVDLGGLTDPIGNISSSNSDNTVLTETADGTIPIASAPTGTAQRLKSGVTSTSTVASNESASRIYLVKNGVAAGNLTQINAAIPANGFLVQSNATKDQAYTVTIPATGTGITDGVYDIVVLDLAGNASAITPGWLTIDNTAPTATIARQTATPSTATSLNFVVTFNEPVTGVDAADFDPITSSTVSNPVIGAITPNSTTEYIVTVTSFTGQTGQGNVKSILNLDFASSPIINDGASNLFTGIITGSEEQYEVDNTAPSLSPNQMSLKLNGAGNETITFTLNEELNVAAGAVSGFTVSNGTISTAVYSGKGTTNTITLTSGGDGQWTSATTVSYNPAVGLLNDLIGLPLASIINKAVVEPLINLGAGDIAITSVNSDDDLFSVVFLRTVPAQTQVIFSDRGLNTTALPYTIEDFTGDGLFTFTATTTINAGTEILFTSGSGANYSCNPAYGTVTNDSEKVELSASGGDNLIIYQTDGTDIYLITATKLSGNQGWDSNPNSNAETGEPTALGANNYLLIGDNDNGAYRRTATASTFDGSATQLKALINDTGNWDRDDNPAAVDLPGDTAPADWNAFVSGLNYTIRPKINSVNIPDVAMKVGDVVTATINIDDDSNAIPMTLLSGTIGGFNLTPATLTRFSATSYTAQFTIAEGGTNVPAGNNIPIANLVIRNNLNNSNTAFSGNDNPAGTLDAIDAVSPKVTSIARQTAANGWSTTFGTSAPSVVFRVTFSENIQPLTLTAADFQVVPGTGVSGGSVTGIVAQTANTVFDVTVGGYSGTGTIQLNYRDSEVNAIGGSVLDVAGNTTISTVGGALDGSVSGPYYTIVPPEPTLDVTDLNTSNITTTSVQLNWTSQPAAQHPTHWLVVARPVGGNYPPFPTVFGDGVAVSNGTFAKNVDRCCGGGNYSVVFNGLNSGVSYDFRIYPYTLASNVSSDNIDYRTTSPGTVTGVALATGNQTTVSLISSLSTISSLADTPAEVVSTFTFRIKDDGASDAVDNAPTKFSSIRITPGIGNDISDWTQAFTYARLEVTSGTGLGATLTGTVDYNVFSPNTSSIVFSAGTSDDNTDAGYIDDNAFKEYTLKIHLKPNMSGTLNLPAIIDNLNFVFTAASGNVTLENSTGGQLSSQFLASSATTPSTSNAVSVVAAQLLFDQPGAASSPTNPQSVIGVGIPFSLTNGGGSTPNPQVYALDLNHNLDLDFENANGNSGTVTNTLNLGQSYTPSFVDGVLSLASFSFTEGNNSTPTQIVVAGTGTPSVTPVNSTNVTAFISNLTLISAETAAASELANFPSTRTSVPPSTDFNFDFRITDDNGANTTTYSNNDNLPTIVQSITITQDTNNGINGGGADASTFDDWTKSIGGARLSDGVNSVDIAPGSNITANSLIFALPVSMQTISDGGFKVFTLSIWLKNPVDVALQDILDNKDFAFSINQGNVSIGAANTTSTLANSSTNTGDGRNVVQVTASQLDFTTQWLTNATQSYSTALDADAVTVGVQSAVLKARDANQNRDLDYGAAVTLATTSLTDYPLANHTGLNFTSGQLTLTNLLVNSTATSPNNGVTRIIATSGLLTSDNVINSYRGKDFVLTYSSASAVIKDTNFRSNQTYASGNGYAENILYKNYQNAIFTANTDGIALDRFILQDGGGSSDADGNATNIQSITLNISNYQYIRTVAIYDGNTLITQKAVSGNITPTGDLTFTSTVLAPFTNPLIANDNGNNDFTVYVTFNQTGIVDNQVIEVRINGVTAFSTNSSSMNPSSVSTVFGTLVAAENENKIEVVAEQIDFTTIPSSASVNVSFTVVAQARDAFANLDADYNGAVTANGNTAGYSIANPPSGSFVGGILNYPIDNVGTTGTDEGFQFTSGTTFTRLTLSSGAANSSGGSVDAGAISGTSPLPGIDVKTSFDSWLFFDPSITYTQRIDFVNKQETSTTNASQLLGKVVLHDGGSAFSTLVAIDNPSPGDRLQATHKDVDGAFTKIDNFKLHITNHATIRKVGIYTAGGTQIGTDQTPDSNGEVTFTGLATHFAPDDGRYEYFLRASFNQTVTDLTQLVVQIRSVAHNSGSKFAEQFLPTPPATYIAGVDGAGVYGDATPTSVIIAGAPVLINRLDVVATSLDFVTQPSAYAGINQPIDGTTGGSTGIVNARDKFTNLDTEFNFAYTISSPEAAITPSSTNFTNGVLNLTGMQYDDAGNGTLQVTSNGLDSNVSSSANSILCSRVDVINVSVLNDQTNGVELSESLKGGTTNKRIFGLNFTADHTTVDEPKLNAFSIQFVDEENPADIKAYPYTKGTSSNIFKNFKLFAAEGNGAPVALAEGTDYTITPEQSQKLLNENPLVSTDWKDKLTFTLTNPVPLFTSNYKFYINVDVDVNVSVGTKPITPVLIDLGYSDRLASPTTTATNTNINVSKGSATGSVKGIRRKFASTKPPVLVSTSPANGTLNVDWALNQIKLRFDVPVVSFDGIIKVYNRSTGALRATFTANTGKYVDNGTALSTQVVPELVFDAPVGFDFKPDTVYYVTVEKGVFSNIDATQRRGISDEGFNLFGGISYNGTFYFKGSSQISPSLTGTDITKYYYTPTSATFNVKFDKPGKVYYMVAHPTVKTVLGVPTAATAPVRVTNAQILNPATYTNTDVVAFGSTIINQQSPNFQFVTINATLTAGVDYHVYMFAENDAQPTAFATVAPYGSQTNSFAVNTDGPTLKIRRTAANTTNVNNPRFEVCSGSFVRMEEPIIISEILVGNFQSGSAQTFNLLLPTGFQFDVTKTPTIILNGSDFTVSSQSTRYRSSTLLEITFTNTGNTSLDNIQIQDLFIAASAPDLSGNIVRFGGSGLSIIADDRVLARISSSSASSIAFSNSFSEVFNKEKDYTIQYPWQPYSQISGSGKPVNYIPDNFATTVRLLPDPPTGDYGASFFSGSGLTNDELTLSAVALDASFNITLTRTDPNGCLTSTVEQYLVYDHTKAIPELLKTTAPGVAFNVSGTKMGLIPGTPNLTTNVPGTPPSTLRTNDVVLFDGLAGYQMIDLFADIPARTRSSNQVLDFNSVGWNRLVNQIPRLKTSFVDTNLGQTFKTFNWEFSDLINKSKTDAEGVQYPYDPAGRFARIVQSNGTGNGKTFFEAGSLGTIEFTGIYQSTADFSVFVPFRQEVELFIPAISVVEVEGQSAIDNNGVAIFCEAGNAFTITGYPLATSSDVTGTFTLKDDLTGAVITDPGFVDNGNGTATFDPKKTVLKNGFKVIRVEYTYKQNNSPAVATGFTKIRVTPNPIANFTTSTLCEDIDVQFTDTTVNPIPGDVTITEWTWGFGDANSPENSATTQNPLHMYAATGLYPGASLSVKTNFGCASVTPKSIDLQIGGTPVVNFEFDGVSKADSFNFLNLSSTSTNDSFKQLDWNFGDGSAIKSVTSNFNPAVVYKYNSPGEYTVNLKVTSVIGCVNNLDKKLIVLDQFTPSNLQAYDQSFETNNGNWQASNLPFIIGKTNQAPSSWAYGNTTLTATVTGTPNTTKMWKTNLNGPYNPREESALYSPSFDLSSLERPMVSFNSFVQFINSDGVVIQYSTDDKNVADPTKKWEVLGSIGTGVDWINEQNIAAKPGRQITGDFGWSGLLATNWKESKYALSNEPGKAAVAKAKKIVFRFALGAVRDVVNTDGFAMDNFRLGERTRTVLLESFANAANTDPSEKIVNDYIRDTFNKSIGTDVVKLNYHVGFPGLDPFNQDNQADPSSRALYYEVAKTPKSVLDGNDGSTLQKPNFNTWGEGAYNSQTLQLANADIIIHAPNDITAPPLVNTDGITFEVTVNAKTAGLIANRTILHAIVVEQMVAKGALSQAKQAMVKSNEDQFAYIVKKMLPSAAGTRFATALPGGSTRKFGPFTWKPDPTKFYTPNTGDLAVVAFLQDEVTRTVYQSEIVEGLNDPTINVVTGIETILPEQVNVFPNPANKEFLVELPGVVQSDIELQMIDQIGRIHPGGKIPAGKNSQTVDVSELAEGIYILQIGSGSNGAVRKKVMVVRKD